MTSCPSATRRSLRCEPMKPAAPVTKQRKRSLLAARTVADQAAPRKPAVRRAPPLGSQLFCMLRHASRLSGTASLAWPGLPLIYLLLPGHPLGLVPGPPLGDAALAFAVVIGLSACLGWRVSARVWR